MAIALYINGKLEELSELEPGATLAEGIGVLALKADRIAVEQNGTIVPRTEWSKARLQAQDRLEIVHFVGGGRQPD